jgi:hypothetical protein
MLRHKVSATLLKQKSVTTGSIHFGLKEKTMMMLRILAVMLIAAMTLGSNCGGGSSSPGASSGVKVKALIAVPNITSTSNFAFDIGGVDSATGRYYFTDRNNASVDVIDMTTNTFVTMIKGGFAGCNTGPSCVGADNSKSGPDGLNVIPGTNFIYVGDVNSVKIIDKTTNTVVNTIHIGGSSGLRADEGCYDSDHKIYMINSPEETPPFATFIDTTTQKIIATLLFVDPGTGPGGTPAAGLEACAYDKGTQSFIVNNDGTTANPHGEANVIPAAFILAQANPANPPTLSFPVPTPANGFKIFPEGNCDPTGLDLGPGTDMIISCREGTTGAPLLVLIMNRTNGAILATLNAGGGDQVWYDAATNRYYLGASRWTASGLAAVGGACSGASPCTPTLTVVDAATRSLVVQTVSGNNAHSVAVDPVTHQAFMPYSSAAAPGGCATCSTYPNGGVLVYSTQ